MSTPHHSNDIRRFYVLPIKETRVTATSSEGGRQIFESPVKSNILCNPTRSGESAALQGVSEKCCI